MIRASGACCLPGTYQEVFPNLQVVKVKYEVQQLAGSRGMMMRTRRLWWALKCAPGAQGQNCSGPGPPSLLQPPQSSHLWPDFQGRNSLRDGEAVVLQGTEHWVGYLSNTPP